MSVTPGIKGTRMTNGMSVAANNPKLCRISRLSHPVQRRCSWGSASFRSSNTRSQRDTTHMNSSAAAFPQESSVTCNSFFNWSITSATKADCISGSPPENVTPPSHLKSLPPTVTAKFLKTADANPPGMFRLKRDDRSQGSHHPPYNGWPPLYPRVAGFLILWGTKKLNSKKKQCQNRAPANSCSASVLTPFAALNGRSFLKEHL